MRVGSGIGPRTCAPVRFAVETISLVVTPYRDDVELSVLDGDGVPLSRQVRLPGLQADEGVQERLIGEIRRTLLTAPQHLTKGREIQDLRVCGTSDGAADLIKMAMIRIDRLLAEEGWKTRMLLQVHDELVLEAPAEEAERASAMVKREMEGVYQLAVPLVVETGIGENWRDAK